MKEKKARIIVEPEISKHAKTYQPVPCPPAQSYLFLPQSNYNLCYNSYSFISHTEWYKEFVGWESKSNLGYTMALLSEIGYSNLSESHYCIFRTIARTCV